MSTYKRFNGKRVKRGDKNYDRATWYFRFKMRGRLYHQSIPEARTLEEAKQAETAIKQQLYNNKFNPSADKTLFSDFVASTYLPYAEQKNVSIATKRVHVKNLLSFFGTSTLREITPNDCRAYQQKRSKAKKADGNLLSPASVNREMTTLSKIFTLALQEELIDRNPCGFVAKLKESKPRDRLLTEEERQRFWNELTKDHQLWRIVMLAINTGLRKGQILALRKDDIDFERGRVKVIASKGREERIVPVNGTALEVLRGAAAEATDYLFCGQKTRRQLGDFKKKWYKCLKDASIDNFKFHDLRHAFASELMRRNVHPVIIKDLLGHGEIKMSERYMNTDFELLSDAVNRIAVSNPEPIKDEGEIG